MQEPLAYKMKMQGKDVPGFQSVPSYVDAFKSLEKKFGVKKSGQWTVEQEEAFAEQFERWIRGGGTVEGLEKEFKQMRGWMEELYRNAHNSPMRNSITDEIKGIFTQIFGRQGLPTFLTTRDHDTLTQAIADSIEDGVSSEDTLVDLGLNLSNWSLETEVEDVTQGVLKYLIDLN